MLVLVLIIARERSHSGNSTVQINELDTQEFFKMKCELDPHSLERSGNKPHPI